MLTLEYLESGVRTVEQSFDEVCECLDMYLAAQEPFKPAYSYEQMEADMLEACNGDPSLKADIVADILESELYPFLEIPLTFEQRRKARKQRDGLYGSLRKFGAHAREMIAERKAADGTLLHGGERFRIVTARKHFGGYKRSKQWERKQPVWQIVIEAEASGQGVLTLACNPIRDNQMKWIELNPEDKSQWKMRWAVTKAGREYLQLVKL
jgi:hypothetical protein